MGAVDSYARLSREEIINAALRITQRAGFDSLTMRALAEELGVTTMAPYHYVKSKHELMAMIVDAAVAEIEIPVAGSWQTRHRLLSQAVDDVYRRYAHAMVVNLELQATPAGRAILEAARRILVDAGLEGNYLEAALAYWQLYTIGRLVCTAGSPPQRSMKRGRKPKAPPGSEQRSGWRETVLSEPYFEVAHGMFYAGVEALLERQRTSTTDAAASTPIQR